MYIGFGCRWNRLDEPFLTVVPKPLLTELNNHIAKLLIILMIITWWKVTSSQFGGQSHSVPFRIPFSKVASHEFLEVPLNFESGILACILPVGWKEICISLQFLPFPALNNLYVILLNCISSYQQPLPSTQVRLHRNGCFYPKCWQSLGNNTANSHTLWKLPWLHTPVDIHFSCSF